MKPLSTALRVSEFWLKWFAAYNRRYLRRHFHSLRILKHGLPCLTNQSTVIFLNHASWWDPLVCLFLAREFFPDRASFAPIDAAMLERYRFFKRLGFFGIEPGTVRGARSLFGTAEQLLGSSHNLLWLTPQGRFADPRERPVELQSGLGALAARFPQAAFVPLAIEYPFWTESKSEILVAFGESITPSDAPNEWTEVFAGQLEKTQAELATYSLGRNPHDWQLLNRGRSGFAGIYGRWLRLRGADLAAEPAR